MTEERAFVKHYHKVWRVCEGPRQSVAQDILVFEDVRDEGAPTYKDEPGKGRGFNGEGGVKHLARLTADLSCIPTGELERRRGKDGREYFVVYYDIEMTYYSACTRYALVYKGVRYDSVSAEYV